MYFFDADYADFTDFKQVAGFFYKKSKTSYSPYTNLLIQNSHGLMKQLNIRKAVIEDLPVLTDIYNQAIKANQTADSSPMTTADRMSWFTAHQNPQFPLIVAVANNAVCGYATLSNYRGGRAALRKVVEISYYIHQDHQRKGLGTTLLQKSLVLAEELGFKHAVAILLETNSPSIHLLEKNFLQKKKISLFLLLKYQL